MRRTSFIVVTAIVIASALPLYCQTSATAQCPPVEVPFLAGQNIFTPELEQTLGELFAEEQERSFGVIDDDVVNAYMQQIVDRLLATLPTEHMPVHVYLTNDAALNAWSIPGRVYVTRKLVAFAQSEDELAGVLAHELGHIVTRQMAVEFTAQLRQALGITSIVDRDDLYSRYHQMVETLARDPNKRRRDPNQEQRDQLLADRTAVLMMRRAGYDPNAFAAHFDRLVETKGKTGSWLSELFRTTDPDQKRLREIIQEAEVMTASCVVPKPADNGFKEWQVQVRTYSGSGHRELLHDVLLRQKFEPPLRGDIRQLHFSPDGNYILAQDYSSIWVLSRKELKSLFRIDAPDAMLAHFTPDSSAVVFVTASDRVERWDVADQERASVYQLATTKECGLRELSPDGSLLACTYAYSQPKLNTYMRGTPEQVIFTSENVITGLSVFEVATGTVKFDQPKFDMGTTGSSSEAVHLHFSPDGKYFIASSVDGELALSLPGFRPVDLPKELRVLLRGGFVFLDSARLLAHNNSDPKNSAIVTFPGGEIEQRLHVGDLLMPVTKGAFVIEGLRQGGRLGLLDLTKISFLVSTNTDGLDAYDSVFVSDRANGDVGLYEVATSRLLGTIALPFGPLTSVHSFDVSADGIWTAVSERTRGAVWNVQSGQRAIYLRGFQAAHFAGDVLWAEMAPFGTQDRTFVRITPSPPSVNAQLTVTKDIAKNTAFRQVGEYLAVVHSETNKLVVTGGEIQNKIRGTSLEMRDLTTGASLWTYSFADGIGIFNMPSVHISDGHVVLVFDPEMAKLQAKLEQMLQAAMPQGEKQSRVTEVLLLLDAKSGKIEGALPIATAPHPMWLFSPERFAVGIQVAGDRILVSEGNRITSYSLSGRKEVGSGFGDRLVVNSKRELVASTNDRWHITLSELTTLAKMDQFAFSSPVVSMKFSADGSKLYVITQDQTFFALGTGRPAAVKSASQD